MADPRMRKPEWLKVRLPSGETYRGVRETLSASGLHTVCEEARCPNLAECWNCGTATFLILGHLCTRGCRFCAVTRGDPGGEVDPSEAARVAHSAREIGLRYVVITSVTRDDLPDGGASVFADAVHRLRELSPPPLVELLIPDYHRAALETVLRAQPDVIAHNVEVVARLTPTLRHSRFAYGRSLEVLRRTRAWSAESITKSSIMLGLGETDREVAATMGDLIDAGVNILVLGQYLQPTPAHAPVAEFVAPSRFEELAERGRGMGFDFVAAGPLVRTSYRAAEAYVQQRKARQEV